MEDTTPENAGSLAHEQLPELTVQELRFVDEYLADPCIPRAFQRAFSEYSSQMSRGVSTLNSIAVRAYQKFNDPRVKAHIEYRLQERRAWVDVDEKRVLMELAAIAFADPLDLYLECTDTGNPVPRPWNDVPPLARKAISGIKVKRKRLVSDEDATAWEVEELEYKMNSKNEALRALCQKLGLFKDDVSNGTSAANLPIELLTTLLAKLGSNGGRVGSVGDSGSVGAKPRPAE